MSCLTLPIIYMYARGSKKLSLQGSRGSLIQKCFVNLPLSILLLAIG